MVWHTTGLRWLRWRLWWRLQLWWNTAIGSVSYICAFFFRHFIISNYIDLYTLLCYHYCAHCYHMYFIGVSGLRVLPLLSINGKWYFIVFGYKQTHKTCNTERRCGFFDSIWYIFHFYRASAYWRAILMQQFCLSVCLSVCPSVSPSVPFRYSMETA